LIFEEREKELLGQSKSGDGEDCKVLPSKSDSKRETDWVETFNREKKK